MEHDWPVYLARRAAKRAARSLAGSDVGKPPLPPPPPAPPPLGPGALGGTSGGPRGGGAPPAVEPNATIAAHPNNTNQQPATSNQQHTQTGYAPRAGPGPDGTAVDGTAEGTDKPCFANKSATFKFASEPISIIKPSTWSIGIVVDIDLQNQRNTMLTLRATPR